MVSDPQSAVAEQQNHEASRIILFRSNRVNRNSIVPLSAALDPIYDEFQARPIFLPSTEQLEQYAPHDSAGSPIPLLYSFMTAAKNQVATEIAWLKRRFPGRFVLIAGGSHPSGDPAGALALGFDHVVIGPGESIIGSIIRAVFSASSSEQPASEQGRIWKASAPVRLSDYYPFSRRYPSYSPIEISRGCPWHCRFCQAPQLCDSSVQHRPLEILAAAMSMAVQRGNRHARFVSPSAFCYGSSSGIEPNPESVRELLLVTRGVGMLKINFGIFPADVRPESVTPELLQLVNEYCTNRTINLGLQSGSDRLLLALHRGHTVAQGLAAVAMIKQARLLPMVDLILGFPMETEEDQEATLAIAEQLIHSKKVLVQLHWFMPLPGTPLAGMSAQPLTAWIQRRLEKLSLSGRLSGWWRDQASGSAAGASQGCDELLGSGGSSSSAGRQRRPKTINKG